MELSYLVIFTNDTAYCISQYTKKLYIAPIAGVQGSAFWCCILINVNKTHSCGTSWLVVPILLCTMAEALFRELKDRSYNLNPVVDTRGRGAMEQLPPPQ